MMTDGMSPEQFNAALGALEERLGLRCDAIERHIDDHTASVTSLWGLT